MQVERGGRLNLQEDLAEAKDRAWAAEQAGYNRLRQLAEIVPEGIFGTERLRQAFETKPTAIVCMDEGVSLADPVATEVALAGSGVFFTDEEAAQTATALRTHGLLIDTVTYHEACGAAGLYAARHGLLPEGSARWAAERLMRLLGLPGPPAKVGYSEAKLPMQRDPRFHHAVAAVVDGTGRINLPILEFPASLQLSACYYPNPHRLAEEVALAETIALDPVHGFGERFTPEQPFLIVLVGDEDDRDWNLTALKEALRPKLWRADGRSQLLALPIRGLPPLKA